MMKTALRLAERGYIPDMIVRMGIRKIVEARLKEEAASSETEQEALFLNTVAELKKSPIALVPEKANEQHYEVPPDFFKLALGKHLKYSSCYYPECSTTLDEAEKAMLEMTCDRAELQANMDVLELGCGWGSLTLFMAEHFPGIRITAVSNSADQRDFILATAREKGLGNIEVMTNDMNEFRTERKFDRVVSIEMFEHMRNYKVLLQRIAEWLKPEGKLFVHIFCHESFVYPFEIRDESDWMAKYFFSGGIMPSYDLFGHFQDDLCIEKKWKVSGIHYERTARHWLENMDKKKDEIMNVFENFYGNEDAQLWFVRWRFFFMACEEMFGYNDGNDWFVGHYLFNKKLNFVC